MSSLMITFGLRTARAAGPESIIAPRPYTTRPRMNHLYAATWMRYQRGGLLHEPRFRLWTSTIVSQS